MNAPAGPRAAWLSERLLLVSATDPGRGAPTARAGASASSSPLDIARFDAPGHNGSPRAAVSICRLPATITRSSAEVAIELEGETFTLGQDRSSGLGDDLTSLLRLDLAGLGAETRSDLLRFIVNAVGEDLHGPGGLILAKKLALMRDVLRERLPYCTVREDEPLGLHVDEIHGIDDRTFWLKGWVWDVDTPLDALTFMSPEGYDIEVLGSAFRYRRRDIEEMYANSNGERPDSGFLACVRLDVPSRLSTGWIAQLRNARGVGVEVEGPEVKRGLAGARLAILRDLATVEQSSDRLVADQVRPAITSIQRRIAETAAVQRDERYGEPPTEPDVSIVIPLGKREDALDQQFTNFVRDPDIARAELIYLVGNARISQNLISKATELQWLYGIPFRLVSLYQKARATAKMNLGASLATAPNLLFMSPDVFPDAPGWLSRLLAFKCDKPDVGAVGPMLMYEDGSVQHAGVYFDRASPQELRLLEPPGRQLWEPRYRFKGLPESFAGVTAASPVPAVSSACLLVGRQHFEEVGGFRNMHVDSDFEAADLCLRLGEAGHTNWYCPDAKLHYLEGRSESELPVPRTRYDVMLHSQVWGERIAGSAS